MADFITGAVAINKNGMFLNGISLMENTEENPAAFFKSAYGFLGMEYPKFHKMDLLCRLGMLATEVLERELKLKERFPDDAVALVFSNQSSSLESDKQHWQLLEEGSASPAVFVYTLPNIVMGEIAIKHKWHGESVFFVMDTFDAETLVKNAQMMMQGETLACILAWVNFLGDDWEANFFAIEKTGELPLTAGNLERNF